jgi:hypothetical protein
MLIQCQSFCGDYACPFGEVVISGSDGTGSNTQVLVVRHVWVPAATSHHARHLLPPIPESLVLIAPTRYRKPPGEADGSLRASQAGWKRRSGLTDGEILSTHDYQDEGVYLA